MVNTNRIINTIRKAKTIISIRLFITGVFTFSFNTIFFFWNYALTVSNIEDTLIRNLYSNQK